MKHYGKFLPFFGRPVEYISNDIERLYREKEYFLEKLRYLEQEIKEREDEFLDYIKDEWTSEEIEEAKNKADEYNNKKRPSKY